MPPRPQVPGGCTHPPIVNMTGDVVSPKVHYGDGLDGLVTCDMCKHIIGRMEGGRIVPA